MGHGLLGFAAPIFVVGLVGLSGLSALTGCGPGTSRTTMPPAMGDPCSNGMHRCQGSMWQACSASGFFADKMKCDAACDPGLGCVACAPKTTFCDGDTVRDCDGNGVPAGARTTCVAGGCIAGTCTDPCGKAAAEFSYLGCDYFPTVTANSGLVSASHFAVAVANPSLDTTVNATITRGGKPVTTVQIPPSGLQTIQLPWVMELKEPFADPNLKGAEASVQLTGGAYKLSTDAPVTVYQFNPIEFQIRPNCDPSKPADMSCFTYTNDASLLLPISTLTSHYIAIARATFMLQRTAFGQVSYTKYPGFISIVAGEQTRTSVTVKFTAPTIAGINGSVAAYKTNQTAMFTLQQGDVVQLLSDAPMTCKPSSTDMQTVPDGIGGTYQITYGYCDLSAAYDLTGTEITADHKIAVFGGHDCTFIPFNRWACDHLEEEMLPLESWGKDYLGVHTRRNPPTTPDYWRVVAGADGTVIDFNPPTVHPQVTLNKGEWTEFPSKTDFEATSNNAFALVQYMVGQDFYGLGSNPNNPGDPAMSQAVPIEQYRNSYIFLTPPSYKLNYVNVTAPAGTVVSLDGTPIDMAKFLPVGTGKYMAARLDTTAGTHQISAAVPIGISVYGLAPYTAYMYPGGLDVKQINVQ